MRGSHTPPRIPEIKSILAYVQLAGRHSAEEFCKLAPHPVLVLGTFLTVDDGRFLTLGSGAELSDGAVQVVEVSKSQANAFAAMITVGRARNNDVQIREASVSKFHGYFQQDTQGELTLIDAKSTCGTWVNGTKLVPNEKVPVPSGANLQFGGVPAACYAPSDFYQLLQELLNGGASR